MLILSPTFPISFKVEKLANLEAIRKKVINWLILGKKLLIQIGSRKAGGEKRGGNCLCACPPQSFAPRLEGWVFTYSFFCE